MPDTLAGTGALFRLAVRRDRWTLPCWVVGFAAMAGFSAAATADLYPDLPARVEAADVINATPSLVALYGRIYDPTSLGALALIKLTAFGAAMVAVLMVVVTARHTRAEEVEGRVELIGAGIVGRDAPLAAALLFTGGASLTLGAATTVALIAAGLPLAGSVAFGLAWAGAGIAFAAVTAVAAQITTGSRGTIGLGVAAIALAYVLRAVGDIPESGPAVASWCSPIGWTQQVRPFAGDRYTLLLLPLLFASVLVPVAMWLRSRRDLGAGLLADRPGPAQGGPTSAWGLALRSGRGVLLSWATGVIAFGVLVGTLTSSVSGMLDSPSMQRFLVALGGEQGIVDMFLAAELSIVGSVVAEFGIAIAGHLRTEESAGRTELVIATPVARWRWAAGHLGLALGGVAVLMTLAGVSLGVGYALDVGDTGMIVELMPAALARVPAAWVFTALVMAVFGWAPRSTAFVWGAYAVSFVLVELGALWELPTWLLDVSPFVHSPKLPGGGDVLAPVTTLTAVAAALTAIGLAGWRRRDLAP